MRALLLVLPRYALHASRYRIAVRSLLEVLPAHIELRLAVHEGVAADLSRLLDQIGRLPPHRIDRVPDSVEMSVWSRDLGLVASDGALVQPVAIRRLDDGSLGDLLDLPRRQVPLFFEGGNVLVGDDFWLVGGDALDHSVRLGLTSKTDPAGGFERLLDGRRLIRVAATACPPAGESRLLLNGEPWTERIHRGSIAPTVQPAYHIDLFVSLAGRDAEGRPVVLVGDPALAAHQTGIPLPPHACPERFDEVAEGLSAQGLRVVRNPLPMCFWDDRQTRCRSWYYASSNNVLVEVGPMRRRVWMPSFAVEPWRRLAVTDAANRAIWHGLGFEVVDVAGGHALAQDLGGIHCVAGLALRG